MAFRYSRPFDDKRLIQSLYRRVDWLDQRIVVAVNKGADAIVKEAQANAPVDTHNLESAIHISERTTRRNNIAINIEVSGVGDDGRDVAEYAMVMHESFYNLGPLSIEKQASDSNHIIGRKYLERAVDKQKPAIIAAISKAVKDSF